MMFLRKLPKSDGYDPQKVGMYMMDSLTNSWLLMGGERMDGTVFG